MAKMNWTYGAGHNKEQDATYKVLDKHFSSTFTLLNEIQNILKPYRDTRTRQYRRDIKLIEQLLGNVYQDLDELDK